MTCGVRLDDLKDTNLLLIIMTAGLLLRKFLALTFARAYDFIVQKQRADLIPSVFKLQPQRANLTNLSDGLVPFQIIQLHQTIDVFCPRHQAPFSARCHSSGMSETRTSAPTL